MDPCHAIYSNPSNQHKMICTPRVHDHLQITHACAFSCYFPTPMAVCNVNATSRLTILTRSSPSSSNLTSPKSLVATLCDLPANASAPSMLVNVTAVGEGLNATDVSVYEATRAQCTWQSYWPSDPKTVTFNCSFGTLDGTAYAIFSASKAGV